MSQGRPKDLYQMDLVSIVRQRSTSVTSYLFIRYTTSRKKGVVQAGNAYDPKKKYTKTDTHF